MAHVARVASIAFSRNLNNEEVCTSSRIKSPACPKRVSVRSSTFVGKSGSVFLGKTSHKARNTSLHAVVESVAASAFGADAGMDDLGADSGAEMGVYDEFQSLLDGFDFQGRLGDTVTGLVFKIDRFGAYVDIGAKAAAFCPNYEAGLKKVSDISEVLELGSKVDFVIVNDRDPSGALTLSLRRIQLEEAWQRLQDLAAADETVEGKVVLINRGGVVIEVENLRGFVPTSHLAMNWQTAMKEETLIGQEIPCKFLEVDPTTARIVLSNKRAAVEKDLASFKVGDVVEGTVQDVKPYGAFVEIGGINGLLHISQISHERVADVQSVLAVGDKIKVMILSQDRERGRVSLSTRKLEPTPGDMIRNPQKVFNKADEMAASFKERVAAAEAATIGEENAAMAAGGYQEAQV